MATFRALTVQSGIQTQIKAPDVLSVGAGVTTDSGNLSLSATGTDVQVASGKNLSWSAAGAGNFDASSQSGIFKTSTGAVTIGPGAISISGNATMQAGTLLSTTGTGNINLPNNGSAKFQIETVAVSANVTAANLGTLTAGSSSNADALHTHTAVGAADLVDTGLTTTGLANGDFGYISAADTISKTDNAAIGTSRLYGANEGTAGSMTIEGVIESAKFTTAGGSPSNGAAVWLAAAADDTGTGAGKLTATAPTTGILAEVGIVRSNANYAGAKTCSVRLQVKAPIQL